MIHTINGKTAAPYSQGAKLLWSQFVQDEDGTKLYVGILAKILIDLQAVYEKATKEGRSETIAWLEAKLYIFRKDAQQYRWEVFQWMETQDIEQMTTAINAILDEEKKSRFQQTTEPEPGN